LRQTEKSESERGSNRMLAARVCVDDLFRETCYLLLL
jgi:hypothetical protein